MNNDSISNSLMLPLSYGMTLPWTQWQVGQTLAAARWAAAMLVLNQRQWQRLSTMLNGGAPLDA